MSYLCREFLIAGDQGGCLLRHDDHFGLLLVSIKLNLACLYCQRLHEWLHLLCIRSTCQGKIVKAHMF